MIKKIKSLFYVSAASIVMLLTSAILPIATSSASAAANTIQQNLIQGCTGASGAGCANTGKNTESSISTVAGNITKIFTVVVGAISVIMIIYGGFRYITSGGASDKVGAAKNTLIYAIIGLVIVALANVIVAVVINQASSQTSSFGN
jgi:lysylphosphatidylglycerol synthetase-like protein (DUF2156 family)